MCLDGVKLLQSGSGGAGGADGEGGSSEQVSACLLFRLQLRVGGFGGSMLAFRFQTRSGGFAFSKGEFGFSYKQLWRIHLQLLVD